MRIRLTLTIAVLVLGCALPVDAKNYSTPGDVPAKKFAQLSGLSDIALSPDGTHVAYLLPIDGRENLIIQPLKGAAIQVPPSNKLDMYWLRWASNERLVFSVGFAARRWRTPSTETRLMSVKKDGTDLQDIVKPARPPRGQKLNLSKAVVPQIQDNVIDWLVDDPEHILVSLDEDLDNRSEVRKLHVVTGSYQNIRRGVVGIQDWISDGSGEVRLGYGYSKAKFGATFITGNGDWQNAKDTQWWDKGFRPQAFTDNPDVVYATGPGHNDVKVLRELNIVSGVLGEVIAGEGKRDVGSMVIDDVTGKPVGIRVPSASSGVVYFDSTYKSMQSLLENAIPDTRLQIVSMSNNRRKVIVRTSSDRDPGSFYLWDRDSKKMNWFADSMPGIEPELMSTVEPIEYPARDGTRIPAYLTYPVGKKRSGLPTVVLPHGGPHARDDSSWWYLSQFLASRGYLVFQPNFRGSTGYGRAFRKAGENQWGGLMQDDVTDGTRWLIDNGISDADDLVIAGWSYGGYSAAIGAVKTPDLFRCAISINGVMNLPTMISNEKKYIGGNVWTKSIGLDGERSKSVSPYHRANEIKVPLLLIHANDDVRVPVRQAERMYRRMKKLGKEVEYIKVDQGGHSMTNESARTKILNSVEAFLQSC